MAKFINFLQSEDSRNVSGHKFFEQFLRRAVGPNVQVLVAHHIVFIDEDGVPNEIPSADTLLFNPELMGKVFGDVQAKVIMLTLAARAPNLRDRVMGDFLDMLDIQDRQAVFDALQAGASAPTTTVGAPAI